LTNTHIVENGIEIPSSGVGEPGVPPFAPALAMRSSLRPVSASGLPIGAQIQT
jgi:isoquinoline 1-oxidoreductase beta subunit